MLLHFVAEGLFCVFNEKIPRISRFLFSFDKIAEELGWDIWFLDDLGSTTWTFD